MAWSIDGNIDGKNGGFSWLFNFSTQKMIKMGEFQLQISPALMALEPMGSPAISTPQRAGLWGCESQLTVVLGGSTTMWLNNHQSAVLTCFEHTVT